MKRFDKYILAFISVVSLLSTSCVKEELLEGKLDLDKIYSKKIIFSASAGWGENEDVITKSGTETYGNRIGNRTLSTNDSVVTLPMGIYVQDGISSSFKSTTKGSVVSNANAITEFKVWANYTKAEGETAMNYFSNVAYEKNTDGIFYPVNEADEYYWPGAGTLNFVSIANVPESNFTPKIENNIIKSFNYTVPADPTQQPDILLAKATAAGNSNSSVPLSFDHILSAVNIKIGSVVKGEIRSITFKNVYNKGEYLVEQGVWIVDKESVGDFTVKMEGGKFVIDGSQASGTPVNTSDATFMFIPQNPGDNAEMVIEFYDSATGHLYSDDESKNPFEAALRGSIAGDNWDKRKTTNYMLSIDESFTMKIEPVGKKLDAHYIIGYANITVDGIDNWEITATTSDGSDVTIQPEEEVNPLAKQGFWTDKVVDANGNITTESARGGSSWSGSGSVKNKLFYIFIPENVNNQDREIELILKGTGSSSASTTKVLLQKYPNWTAGGFGWEVVDDDESGKYGFKWTRKVAYVLKYSWENLTGIGTNYDRDEAEDYISSLITRYNATGYATMVEFKYKDGILGMGQQQRAYIYLDYSKLNNLSGASSISEGISNTKALFNIGGSAASMTFETVLATTLKSKGDTSDPLAFHKVISTDDYHTENKVPAEEGIMNDLSGILTYILKKNLYNLQIIDDGETKTYHPVFDIENDLKWYLPASNQFLHFTPNPNIAGDDKANYWSSTAVDGASQAYIGDGTQKDRDLEYRVIAVRKDENNFGQTTTTVDNSSLQGGNNGSTNNWVE